MINDVVVSAGKDGVISVHPLDSSYSQFAHQTEIDGMEDFRDLYCNQIGACLFMNSGKLGALWVIAPDGSKYDVFAMQDVFLDGMDFWGDEVGIVYGDPVDGKFFIAKTINSGMTWNVLNSKQMPGALENEGGFAASGTGLQTTGDSTVYFGTGLGSRARLFCSYDQGESWIVKDTPMKSGDSFGIYSMYFWSESEGVVIGGSYLDSTYNKGICQYTADGGDSWSDRSKGLLGYCSCVQGTASGDLLIATGRMGTFYSLNKGKSWKVFTEKSYYSCFVTADHIVLSGRDGILEIFEYDLK